MAKKKSAAKSTLTALQAESMAKKAAEKRTIEIELTPAQLAALTSQWKKLKPSEAAQIIFTDGASQTSLIKVAGYSYHGNTCCV